MKYDQEGRDLVTICMEESADLGFSMQLLGNTYCSLARGRPVECMYCGEQEDKNGLYNCINPSYYSMYLDDDVEHVEQ